MTYLLEVDTFYAISNHSLYLDKLMYVFEDYALQHQEQYFLAEFQKNSQK